MSDIKVGLIGGTGLEELLSHSHGEQHQIDTPFGKTSDVIVQTQLEGVDVLMLHRHGRQHLLPPSRVPYRANVFALKQLGCTHIIATAAVGSLRGEFKPRDLVIPDQIIDRTVSRAGTFFEDVTVHVEFAEPFCPLLRRILIEAGKPVEAGAKTGAAEGSAAEPAPSAPAPAATLVHDRGCYVCMEGPAFSTRAESLMHRLWGGDLIGMTAMPEAKLAREAEIAYALVAMVTDYDSWKPKPPAPGSTPVQGAQPETIDPAVLMKEIVSHLQTASASAMDLVSKALRRIASDPASVSGSPAHEALKFAIWSDRAAIDPELIRRLSPLWGRHFG